MADPRLEALGIVDINRPNAPIRVEGNRRFVQGLFGEIEIGDPAHATALLMLTTYEMGRKDQERASRVTTLLRRQAKRQRAANAKAGEDADAQ